MTTVPNGSIGGILAAVVAAGLARLIASDRSGRNAVPRSGIGGFQHSQWWTLGLGVIYGAVAGGALVALELYVLGVLGVPPSLLEAVSATVLWSAILCAGALVAKQVLARQLGTVAGRQVVLFHALYGVGLGLWIRLTWIT